MDLTAPAPPPAPDEPTADPAPEVEALETLEAVDADVELPVIAAAPEAPTVTDPVVSQDPTDTPVFEAPVFEAPVFEAPVPEAPAAEAPVFEAPVFEAPVAEQLADSAPPFVESPVVEPATTETSAMVQAQSEQSAIAEPADAEPSIPEPFAPAAHQRPAIGARGVKAPTGLSTTITVLGVLQVLSMALSVVLAWWAVQQLENTLDAVFTPDADAGISTSTNGLNSALALAGLSGVLGFVAVVLTLVILVCLMAWTSRARQVSAAVSPGQHRFASIWAVISWILPVFLLVIPYLAVSDIYKSADPRTSQTRGRYKGPVPRLIAGWWIAWVVTALMLGALRVTGNADASILNIPTFSALQWVWLLASAIGTGFMIATVQRITSWQAAQLHNGPSEQQPVHTAFDPRFGSEWNDTAPIPGLPAPSPLGGELASAGPYASQQQATQAYLPPDASPSLDQSRINPRDPFSFPPPGQVG